MCLESHHAPAAKFDDRRIVPAGDEREHIAGLSVRPGVGVPHNLHIIGGAEIQIGDVHRDGLSNCAVDGDNSL